jgi:hypothetical protein
MVAIPRKGYTIQTKNGRHGVVSTLIIGLSIIR